MRGKPVKLTREDVSPDAAIDAFVSAEEKTEYAYAELLRLVLNVSTGQEITIRSLISGDARARTSISVSQNDVAVTESWFKFDHHVCSSLWHTRTQMLL